MWHPILARKNPLFHAEIRRDGDVEGGGGGAVGVEFVGVDLAVVGDGGEGGVHDPLLEGGIEGGEFFAGLVEGFEGAGFRRLQGEGDAAVVAKQNLSGGLEGGFGFGFIFRADLGEDGEEEVDLGFGFANVDALFGAGKREKGSAHTFCNSSLKVLNFNLLF